MHFAIRVLGHEWRFFWQLLRADKRIDSIETDI